MTPRQQQVLDYLQDAHRNNEPMPTIREICDHFGWKSTNSALQMLEGLRAAGHVDRRGPSRTLVLLRPEPTRLEAAAARALAVLKTVNASDLLIAELEAALAKEPS